MTPVHPTSLENNGIYSFNASLTGNGYLNEISTIYYFDRTVDLNMSLKMGFILADNGFNGFVSCTCCIVKDLAVHKAIKHYLTFDCNFLTCCDDPSAMILVCCLFLTITIKLNPMIMQMIIILLARHFCPVYSRSLNAHIS